MTIQSRLLSSSVLITVALLLGVTKAHAADAVGDFDTQTDVGTVTPAGKAAFDPAKKEYRITSAGENIWAKHDDFHFLHRKASGDVTITADIALAGEGKVAHRKGCLMIRQDLDADSAYVDVVVHGDGHIAIQYRSAKGEITKDIKSEVTAPATLRIERKGNTFTAWATPKVNEKSAIAVKPEPKQVGTIEVTLKDPVYAGLAVTSHDAKESETAVFSNVTVSTDNKTTPPPK